MWGMEAMPCMDKEVKHFLSTGYGINGGAVQNEQKFGSQTPVLTPLPLTLCVTGLFRSLSGTQFHL